MHTQQNAAYLGTCSFWVRNMHTIGGIAGIRECGGLSENGPHRLMYLNIWFSIGGTAWEGLVGVALL